MIVVAHVLFFCALAVFIAAAVFTSAEFALVGCALLFLTTLALDA